MERKLPDPDICRTRRLFSTQFFLCLVEAPVNCPQLTFVSGYHICNHYLRESFARDETPA